MIELTTNQAYSVATRAALGLALVAISWLAIDYGRMVYMRSSLPPGPFPWPIVGNHGE